MLYEDNNVVRYLMFDRISQNEKYALYVYYECRKGNDGFWSPSDASICDIYAYSMKEKIVIDSKKNSWDSIGTEEYRKAVEE